MMTLDQGTLFLDGAITMQTAPLLQQQGEDLLQGKTAFTLVVNMQAVTQVDSAAVSLLLNWQRLAVQQSLILSLQAVPEKLTRLLHLYNVEDLF